MKTATTLAQMLVRATGLSLLVLGLLFWTGHALSLLQVHILLGFVLVLSLWALAILAARAGVSRGLVLLAIVWGFVTPALGLMHGRLMTGSSHWMMRVLHLLVGMAAMGQAEGLARRIKLVKGWQP